MEIQNPTTVTSGTKLIFVFGKASSFKAIKGRGRYSSTLPQSFSEEMEIGMALNTLPSIQVQYESNAFIKWRKRVRKFAIDLIP